MGLTLETRLELAEGIVRGIEPERATRTPEQEAAIDRLWRNIGAVYARGSSVGQDPPRDETPVGERNTPGAGHATALTEAEVRRRRARSAEAADNARLAGGSISPETREIADAYDRGEVDGDEMVRRVIARHARASKP